MLTTRAQPERRLMCVIAVLAYLTTLAVFALYPPTAATLASSPAGVAHGHVLQLLSSGLVVDGPALPQIVALAVTLIYATSRLGSALTWRAAIGAHLGATLLAYAFVAILYLVDRSLTTPVLAAPDYGISVVFAGVCGAVMRRGKPASIAPVITVLAAVWLIWWWLAGSFDPATLANLEHLLGFMIGAASVRTSVRDRLGDLERGRPVGVEGRDRRVVPGLSLLAILLRPDDAGLVRRVNEPAAARDLDPVSTGLVPVQEETLSDVVLGGSELDVDLVLDPDVGGAQALLARVHPEGRVVQAPVGTLRRKGVLGVDQLVRGDRHRHPRAAERPVV